MHCILLWNVFVWLETTFDIVKYIYRNAIFFIGNINRLNSVSSLCPVAVKMLGSSFFSVVRNPALGHNISLSGYTTPYMY